MPTFYARKHENKYQRNVWEFEYDVQYAHGTKTYNYRVDLQSMTQTNLNTNKVRKIRRLVWSDPQTEREIHV